MFLVGPVATAMEMVICFGSPPFSLCCMLGSYPTLPLSWPLIVVIGLVVCYGMAGCLGLVVPVRVILGQLPLDLACCKLDCRLGAFLADTSAFWTPPDYWDADDIALKMSDTPNVWTDGSREDFSSTGGFEVAGAGVYVPAPELAFGGSVWGVAEEYGDARLERCRAFVPAPGLLQTVQRAELWGAIVALQSYWPCHSGIDNLNVARSIVRLLDRGGLPKPLLLSKMVIWSLLCST